VSKVTQWKRALLDKLNVAELNIKFFLFYGSYEKGKCFPVLN
jgi:hypothetical protein